MSDIRACPHCGHQDLAPATFCATCGMALPDRTRTGPRVVTVKEVAVTGAGRMLQELELRRRSKQAEKSMLVVAVLNTVVGLLVLAALNSKGPFSPQTTGMLVVVGSFGMAAIFWGLYAWSQAQPLPAAIVGLVVYGTLVGINLSLAAAGRTRPSHYRPFGVGVGDVVILAVLIRAIYAGVAHRNLLRENAQTSGNFAAGSRTYV